jgi:hypothetical protein
MKFEAMKMWRKAALGLGGLMLTCVVYGGVTAVVPKGKGLDLDVYFNVTPHPQSVRYSDAFWKVETVSVTADGVDARVVDHLQQKVLTPLALKASDAAGDLDITLSIKKPFFGNGKAESYVLSVSEKKGRVIATLTASDQRGLMHGVQSLRQLCMRLDGACVVRGASIKDWPDVPVRLVKRASGYWLDTAQAYKMNGGSQQLSVQLTDDLSKTKGMFEKLTGNAEKRMMNLLGMVSMGKILVGGETEVTQVLNYYKLMQDTGFTHISIMYDDKPNMMDKVARERWSDYYEGQLDTAELIRKTLASRKPEVGLGYMPNHYYDVNYKGVDEELVDRFQSMLDPSTRLFWAGCGTPGPTVKLSRLRFVQRQTGVDKLWFYTNWPQCGEPYYSPNFGPARQQEFYSPKKEVELVTVSTTTYPRTWPTSFITIADLLWNSEDYDPERSLKLATKELVSPESYDAFYALFKYVGEKAGLPKSIDQMSPYYASTDPEERVRIIKDRNAVMEKLVAACLKCPEAQGERGRKTLESMGLNLDRHLKRLARTEAKEKAAKGKARELTCPLVKTAPVLDGQLTDDAWKGVTESSGFTNLPGSKKAPHDTSFKLCRTSDAIYVAITCHETHMSHPEMQIGDYPNPTVFSKNPGYALWWNSGVEVFFDPGRDGRDVYQIILNPWGQQECFSFDNLKYGYYNIEKKMRRNWKFEGAASRNKDDFTIEFKVPLSLFNTTDLEQGWGFNVSRNRILRPGDGLKYSTWSSGGWGFQDSKYFGKLTFTK